MGFDIIESGFISQILELDVFNDFYGPKNIRGIELQKDFGRSIVIFGMFLVTVSSVIGLYGLFLKGKENKTDFNNKKKSLV